MTVLLNGNVVSRATLSLPAWGVPWLDVELTMPVELTGAVLFEAPGLTWVGMVMSGGVVRGRARYRVAGGAGGWGREISPQGYANDLGVSPSIVLADAAAAVGETLDAVSIPKLGPHFARRGGCASWALNQIAPRAWYVDDDGITRVGARAEQAYAGDATLSEIDPAKRSALYALDSLAGVRPGVVFADLGTPASDVEIRIDSQSIRVKVWCGAPPANRRLEALRQIVESLFPSLRYAGVFEYRVVTVQGERVNLQSARSVSGMPDLARVPTRPGIAGARCSPALGSLVLVAFVGNDPSYPVVVAFESAESPGWAPTSLTLQATELLLQGDGDAVALASLVDSRLSQLKTVIDSVASSIPAPDNAETAAMKAALDLLFWPLPTGSSTIGAE